MDKTFAEKLKQAKKGAGLTQQAMADLMKIPKRTIEEWERGNNKPPEYIQRFVLNELGKKAGDTERETSEWEFVREPNTVDTLGRPVYFARCKTCGFVWTDLYAVKNHFKSCPRCGREMRKEGEGCHT